MTLLISDWRKSISKILKLFPLFIMTSTLFACAHMDAVPVPTQISNNDHDALVKYYDDISKEAKDGLQKNQKLLNQYEEHTHYYGRQGQNVRSHTAANIRYYENVLRESQMMAEHHRKIAMELKSSATKNKAKATQERNFILNSSNKPENNF